jgi:hypothetical protein
MALRHRHALEAKIGNPHWEQQPRVPAGNSILSGRWMQLAGDVPSPGDPPDIPKQRPANAQERNRIAKQMAKAGRRPNVAAIIVDLIKDTPWAQEIRGTVTSYWDEAKTFEELREAANSSAPGYDIHHVVERASAEQDGYSRSKIDGSDNLVRIPRIKHWEINSWYATKNKDFGGVSPRDYLRGKSWEEKDAIGRKALIDAGVLKP